jgi:hypothetical protein
MTAMRENILGHPLARIDSLVSTDRPVLRLHLVLEAGSLLAVLQGLQVAGQQPRLMIYNKEPDASGTCILDFDKVNEPAAEAFVPWLQNIPGVVSVDKEWRPARSPRA